MASNTDSYGINICFSAIYNDSDDSEAAITVKDSDGLYVESHRSGEDIDEVLCQIFSDVEDGIKEHMYGTEDAVEDNSNKLEEQIKSLEIDNHVLEERVRTLQDELNKIKGAEKACGCNKNENTDAQKPITPKSFKDYDDVYDFLRKFLYI